MPKPVKMSLIKNMLSLRAVRKQKAEHGLSAKRDGVRVFFDNGEFGDFVVYKEKTPIFACVIDDGRSFIFESFAGIFKFSKKNTETLPGLGYVGY